MPNIYGFFGGYGKTSGATYLNIYGIYKRINRGVAQTAVGVAQTYETTIESKINYLDSYKNHVNDNKFYTKHYNVSYYIKYK